jgi:hypothetical protein
MAGFRSQADGLRSQLALMGVDPNVVGYESDYTQAIGNLAKGFPTMQARQQQYGQQADQRDFDYRTGRDQVADERYSQEFAYQQARDQIKDEQYKLQFDEDVRRFGLDYGLRAAANANQIANSNASRSLAQQRFNLERGQMDEQNAARSLQADVLSGLGAFDNPDDAAAWLNANAGEITRQLGAKGFNELRAMVPSYFGVDPNAGKQDASTRQRAIELAQKDPRASAYGKDRVDINTLINEYMRLLQGG